jgi:hypothetical protein
VLRGKAGPIARGPLVVALAAVVVMAAVTLALPATLGFEFLGPGRYAYPALPAAAALCAVGVAGVLTSATALRSLIALYSGLAIVMLLAGAFGLPRPPIAGTGLPPPAARVVSVDAGGRYEGLTISVDRIALDSSAGVTWFHVTATNAGSDEIEWNVPPTAAAGKTEATGDYLRSTHLPGDLDPGQSVAGWLYVPMDPSQVTAARSVALRFGGVATPMYRAIGEIDIEVSVT